MLDSGEAYNATAQRGWISQTSTTPLSIVGNARDRNAVADQRLDSFIHMQYSGATGGVAQPARWEAAVQNGIYDVTVAVGDVGTVTGSRHRLTVESVNLVNNFHPGSANKIATVTARIQVTDGKVTLDAAGGTNTKLDYVDIIPVTANVLGVGATLARINFQARRRAGPARLHERHRRRLHAHEGTAGSARPTPPCSTSPATGSTATSCPTSVSTRSCTCSSPDLRRRQPARWQYALPDGHLRRHRLGRRLGGSGRPAATDWPSRASWR